MEDDNKDLLENDLFLINELLDELINSLKGTYTRIYFLEEKMNHVNSKSHMNAYKKRGIDVATLKRTLIGEDIETKKSHINSLEIELDSVLVLEKKLKSEFFNPK